MINYVLIHHWIWFSSIVITILTIFINNTALFSSSTAYFLFRCLVSYNDWGHPLFSLCKNLCKTGIISFSNSWRDLKVCKFRNFYFPCEFCLRNYSLCVKVNFV